MNQVHTPLIKVACKALEEIFLEDGYADKVVPRLLKENKKFGSRDRAWVAETVYELVRYWRKFLFLNQLEDTTLNASSIEKMVLFYIEHKNDVFELTDVIEESFPQWWQQRGLSELGGDWPVVMKALNQKASTYIRLNRWVTSRKKMLEMLNKEGVMYKEVMDNEDAFEILSKNNLQSSNYFKYGWFEFQDISSQEVGHFIGNTQQKTILDACAGAGGKTLQLASMSGNTAKITVSDYHFTRLKLLQQRAERAGVSHLVFKTQEELFSEQKQYDIVLLDVPCSASGTLRRNPGLKWKLTEAELNQQIDLQQTILNQFCALVKPDGYLIYATCSIFPSEGEKQIQTFLYQHPEYQLLEEKRVGLNEKGGDGFYMAKMRR
ncbi:MAG: RsmB/NOP family class I SAM-dependent RNA methyltransferase [Chitinophagales bacterium]|nr:RsmB/NOP family class I SAM-dependent RNA methyltransferase [Chitinophagales bacterium]